MKFAEIFPTPLGIEPVEGHERHKARILQLLEDETLTPNLKSPNLVHTPTAIHEGGDAQTRLRRALPELFEAIRSAARVFGLSAYGNDVNWLITDAWLNKMLPGGSQHMHDHANSLISTIYLVSLAEDAPRTHFHKPVLSVGRPYFELTPQEFNRYNFDYTWLDEAREGNVILFPSYIKHSVPPNESAEPRITLACNLFPETIGNPNYGFKVTPLAD